MAKMLFLTVLLSLGVAMALADDDDLIPVPKSGAYVITEYDEKASKKYGENLGLTPEQEKCMLKLGATKSFGVRFETPDMIHWNVTFYMDGKPHAITVEADKEVAGHSVVVIPVKNFVTLEPKRLNLKQTYENGQVALITWTFKPEYMTITVVTGGVDKSVLTLHKDDTFGL